MDTAAAPFSTKARSIWAAVPRHGLKRSTTHRLEDQVLLLLRVPVILIVTTLHRGLFIAAPSNLLARRVGATRPRLVLAGGLCALVFGLIGTAHALAIAVTRSAAPDWLHLLVLVLLWDAVKVYFLAVAVTVRWIVTLVGGLARRIRSRRCLGASGDPAPVSRPRQAELVPTAARRC
jgi:hypothetical protein